MSDGNPNLMPIYQQVCTSYHNIDTFRATLLGLLPISTGAGVFLLINNFTGEMQKYLVPIGFFGFVVTIELFVYKIYGITKCHALINGGKQIEGWLHIDGQFSHRPDAVLGFMNEPFAAGLIYPAVLAAWTFRGWVFLLPEKAWLIALAVFLVGLAVSFFYDRGLKKENEVFDLTILNQRILQAEENGDQDRLEPLLHPSFTIIRSSGEEQDRQTFLKAVPDNKDLGRTADRVEVRRFGECAVYTCRVTTARDKEGNEVVGHFWNTRLFQRQDNGWRCTAWQVMEICDT